MENLFELYQKYTDSLEAGSDDRELLLQIKKNSQLTSNGKELYEKAVIAQLLYYENETLEEMPRLLKSFNEKLAANRQIENIWSYLNDLLQAKSLTWSKVLIQLGKSTHLSNQLATGSLNIDRLPASLLADIAKKLDANFDKLYILVQEGLSKQRCSTPSAAHFRIAPKSDVVTLNVDPAKINTDLACNQYMEELKKHLANC